MLLHYIFFYIVLLFKKLKLYWSNESVVSTLIEFNRVYTIDSLKQYDFNFLNLYLVC